MEFLITYKLPDDEKETVVIVKANSPFNAVAIFQRTIGDCFFIEIVSVQEVEETEQCLYDTIVCSLSCKGCKLGNQNA